MAKEQKSDKGKEKSAGGKWKLYTLEGGLKRERKSCPKCGAGVFMAQHQDRLSCGKCGYTEFTKEKIIHVFADHHKKERVKVEKPKEEAAVEEAPAKEAKGRSGRK
jgi:small subunit ribosomal protein S27Ae